MVLWELAALEGDLQDDGVHAVTLTTSLGDFFGTGAGTACLQENISVDSEDTVI